MTFVRGAVLTLGGALFCVLAAVCLSVPYAWFYESLFGPPEAQIFFFSPDPIVIDLIVLGLIFACLTAILLLAGKARSAWIATIALAAIPAAVFYSVIRGAGNGAGNSELFAVGVPTFFSFRGFEAAILTAGLIWSFLLHRLAR